MSGSSADLVGVSRWPVSFSSRSGQGELFSRVIYENFQKVVDDVFMSAVVKRVVTVTVTIKTPATHSGVGVFSGRCLRFVRPSNSFDAVLLVLFPTVLLCASVYLQMY